MSDKIKIFDSYSEFQSFDFSSVPQINTVLTLGHSVIGIGAAKYIKIGTVIAHEEGNEGDSISSDGTQWKLVSEPICAEHFGAQPESSFDSSGPINRFLSYITENDVGTASFTGTYVIRNPIEFGLDSRGASIDVKTKHIVGSPRLLVNSPMNVAFYIHGFTNAIWNGKIAISGAGEKKWTEKRPRNRRNCTYGVVLSKCGRSTFDGFYGRDALSYGLLVTSEWKNGGNTNLVNVGDCRFLSCGSGSSSKDDFFYSKWGNNRQIGSAGSGSGQSWIDVSSIPPEDHLIARNYPIIMLANGDKHFVWEIDRANSRIRVFPWIEHDVPEEKFRWVYGGGIAIRGVDANVINIGSVDASFCSITLDMMSFYGPTVQRVVSQNNFTGLCFGLRPNGTMLSANIGTLYTEGSISAIVALKKSVGYKGGYIIANHTNLKLEEDVIDFRLANKRPGGLVHYSIFSEGKLLSYEKKPENLASSHSRLDLDISNKNISRIYKKNRWKVRLDIDKGYNEVFGFDSAQLTMLGTGENYAPTGKFEFFSKDSSATVNGMSVWSVEGFIGPAIFSIYYEFKTNNFTVAISNKA